MSFSKSFEELKFLKGQKTRGLLSNLSRVKVPNLSDIPIVNTLL